MLWRKFGYQNPKLAVKQLQFGHELYSSSTLQESKTCYMLQGQRKEDVVYASIVHHLLLGSDTAESKLQHLRDCLAIT